MSKGIKVDASGFGAAFDGILDDFFAQTSIENKKAVSAAGRECVSELKETSPSLSGDYAAGWRMKTQFDEFGGYYVRVFNAAKPSLTHLLEFGHAGPQPANHHPHIAPAADNAQGVLLNGLSHG